MMKISDLEALEKLYPDKCHVYCSLCKYCTCTNQGEFYCTIDNEVLETDYIFFCGNYEEYIEECE